MRAEASQVPKRVGMGMTTLVVVSIVLYAPTFRHGFVHWDDDTYVRENVIVRNGLTWQGLRWAVTTTEASNWHPLTWLSHQLDCQLFGLNPMGHHAISVLLHSLNAALLFYLLQVATGKIVRSWLVAAVWTVHPLAVESVSWISERKNVLSMLLVLLALGAYGRYVHRPSFRRYTQVILLFVLALAAKPVAVMFPVMLLIADFWPFNRIGGWGQPGVSTENAAVPLSQAVREKLPLLVLSAASGIVTIAAQRAGGSLGSIDQYPVRVRVVNAIWAYVSYLGKLIWPANLAALYPIRGSSLSTVRLVLAMLLLLAITGTAWGLRRSKPYLITGWLWYLATLLPMIGIIQVGPQAMADRYTYLPVIGLLVALTWLGSDMADLFRLNPTPRWVAASTILCGLAALTCIQQDLWQDDFHLWSHTLAITTNNYIAERNLGAELIDRGKPDEALPHFERAILLNPRDGAAHLDIGATMLSRGQVDVAIHELTIAAQLPADRTQKFSAYENLAVAYVKLGNATQAREVFHRAAEIDPDSFRHLIGGYERRIQQAPSPNAYFWLAILQGQAGQRSEAQASWAKALALKPEYSSWQRFFDVMSGP